MQQPNQAHLVALPRGEDGGHEANGLRIGRVGQVVLLELELQLAEVVWAWAHTRRVSTSTHHSHKHAHASRTLTIAEMVTHHDHRCDRDPLVRAHAIGPEAPVHHFLVLLLAHAVSVHVVHARFVPANGRRVGYRERHGGQPSKQSVVPFLLVGTSRRVQAGQLRLPLGLGGGDAQLAEEQELQGSLVLGDASRCHSLKVLEDLLQGVNNVAAAGIQVWVCPAEGLPRGPRGDP